MLIPSFVEADHQHAASLSRRVNANSQRIIGCFHVHGKLIKKGEC